MSTHAVARIGGGGTYLYTASSPPRYYAHTRVSMRGDGHDAGNSR